MKKYLIPIIIFLSRWGLNLLSCISKPLAGRWALRLFAAPRKGRLSDKDRQYLEEARWESVTVQGLSVRYYVWDVSDTSNSAPSVLLAHGWESNSARWRNLIRHLQKMGCKIIALDAPAHGDSGGKVFSAVVYAEFIAAVLGKEPAQIAIGHSAGGMALAFYLRGYTASLQKVVLLGVPRDLKTILDQYCKFMGYWPRVSTAMDVFIQQYFGHPVSYYSVELAAEKLTLPCLIIHDENDDIAPMAGAESIAQRWEGSVLVKTQGLGHRLQSAGVYDAIKKWMTEVV